MENESEYVMVKVNESMIACVCAYVLIFVVTGHGIFGFHVFEDWNRRLRHGRNVGSSSVFVYDCCGVRVEGYDFDCEYRYDCDHGVDV